MLYHGSRPSGALLHAYIYICLSVLLWVTGLGAEGDGWIDGMEWNGIGNMMGCPLNTCMYMRGSFAAPPPGNKLVLSRKGKQCRLDQLIIR